MTYQCFLSKPLSARLKAEFPCSINAYAVSSAAATHRYNRNRSITLAIVLTGLYGSKRYIRGGKPKRKAKLTSSEYVDDRITVCELQGKGLGVVAREKIRKGDLILRERPLVVVETIVSLEEQTLKTWNERINQLLKRTDEATQRSFWELSDAHNSPQKSASGVVRTNGLPIESEDGKDYVGVYSWVSRFNHSCIQNVIIAGSLMRV